MPELPDVQVFKEYLDVTALHQPVTRVHLLDADELLDGVSRRTLRRHLEGSRLRSTRRHGKHLFVELAPDDWLRMHFGMTGFLRYFKAGATSAPEYTKLELELGNGFHLAYVNTRKLGALGLVEDVDSYLAAADLGPDAMDLGPRDLRDLLEGRRGGIKSTLMNQSIVAGLGNIYTDEVLFHAGVHPGTRAGSLDPEVVDRVHEAMNEVMAKAIEGRVRSFPEDFLIRHREEGTACPRCAGRIRKMTLAGRTTYYCDRHQE